MCAEKTENYNREIMGSASSMTIQIGALFLVATLSVSCWDGAPRSETGSSEKRGSAPRSTIPESADVEILSVRHGLSDKPEMAWVQGELRNLSSRPLRAEPVVTWYDANGQIADTDVMASIEFQPLAPSDTSPFKAMSHSGTNASTFSTFRIDFKDSSGRKLVVRGPTK